MPFHKLLIFITICISTVIAFVCMIVVLPSLIQFGDIHIKTLRIEGCPD